MREEEQNVFPTFSKIIYLESKKFIWGMFPVSHEKS